MCRKTVVLQMRHANVDFEMIAAATDCWRSGCRVRVVCVEAYVVILLHAADYF